MASIRRSSRPFLPWCWWLAGLLRPLTLLSIAVHPPHLKDLLPPLCYHLVFLPSTTPSVSSAGLARSAHAISILELESTRFPASSGGNYIRPGAHKRHLWRAVCLDEQRKRTIPLSCRCLSCRSVQQWFMAGPLSRWRCFLWSARWTTSNSLRVQHRLLQHH